MGGMVSRTVRAVVFHRCDPCSIPAWIGQVIYKLSLFDMLFFSHTGRKGFSLDSPFFLTHQNQHVLKDVCKIINVGVRSVSVHL